MLWLFHKLKISNLSQSAFVTKSLSQAGFKWMDSGVGVLDIVGLPTANHLKGTLARFINAVFYSVKEMECKQERQLWCVLQKKKNIFVTIFQTAIILC